MPPEFRAIYDGELHAVWKTLRRLGVREHDLEDVAHELFSAVYRRMGEYDPKRPLRPWIVAFAFRIASDYRRRAQHQRETTGEEIETRELHDPSRPIDEQVAAEQERALVNDVLDQLELDRRAVFVMHELEDLTAPEIAEVLAIPLNTVYSRLSRAREEFVAGVRRLRARRSPR